MAIMGESISPHDVVQQYCPEQLRDYKKALTQFYAQDSIANEALSEKMASLEQAIRDKLNGFSTEQVDNYIDSLAMQVSKSAKKTANTKTR